MATQSRGPWHPTRQQRCDTALDPHPGHDVAGGNSMTMKWIAAVVAIAILATGASGRWLVNAQDESMPAPGAGQAAAAPGAQEPAGAEKKVKPMKLHTADEIVS